MKINLALFILTFCFSLSCKEDVTPEENETSNNRPNILLIIADDMGKDATNGFSEGIIKPLTPNIDKIKNEGLSFNNFWVNPTCSPTRSAMITGKYGYRTGVKWASDKLPNSETILQEYINQQTKNTYATAVVGKWHLDGNNTNVNPENLGINYYAGVSGGAVQDYYNWTLTENGSSSSNTNYVTEYLTDLSIKWVSEQEKPWFLWLAYNAPHTPFHTPPAKMHSQGTLPTYKTGDNALRYYFAAIEAMDYQIGRLLSTMSQAEKDNTIIIFLGDNGTPNQVAQNPYSRTTVKGTLYQGGVNAPLFISGKGVSRKGIDENLISDTDIFATIAELTGISSPNANDSKSFKSLLSENGLHRDFLYTEMDDGDNDSWAIRNSKYKLIVNSKGPQEMYQLISDPYETKNLLIETLSTEALNAKASLEAELKKIRK